MDFQLTDQLMREGIAEQFFPGAVLLVAHQGEVRFHRAYGMANLFNRQSMSIETAFDLASLTKPLVTTLAIMLLVQQGKVDLDQPGSHYWSPFSAESKTKITIRHLLCHCSGLPAWRPYYLLLKSMPRTQRIGALKNWVVQEALIAPPGQRSEYSDIGFMVLQWLIEKVAGQPLDQFYHDAILQPLSARDLFFPGSDPSPERTYAATELCAWRNRLLVGEVHDDNAHVIGGISGHAGLFGSANAVWGLLKELLSAYHGTSKNPLFDRSILRAFLARRTGTTWALGFDTPSKTGSSAGKYFGEHSVGHLGYTGTSFWMDPFQGTTVILLTNRVHPTRYNTRIRQFRPLLHDRVMEAIGVK